MITKIEQMQHPLGIRFYKLHVDDFVTGHIWCVAYKYKGCVVSSLVPSFNECARVCKMAMGISPKWMDCSDLVPVVSRTGSSIPTSYGEFYDWLHSLGHTFENI